MKLVVCLCAPVVVRVLNELVDELGRLQLVHQPLGALRSRQNFSFLGDRRQDAVLQGAQQVLTQGETRQVVQTHEHHLDNLDYLVCILLYSHKSETHELPEVVEPFAGYSAEHLDHLLRELEGRLLELDPLAGRVRQQKPEVNVDYVTLDVYQDVPVVAVLNLQHVAHQRVSG